MSKYFNPRLLNAVIAGTGMRNPVRPHVILGSEDGEFVRGDLMDANAIQEFINQKISDLVNNAPEALDTLKELADAIEENGVADLVTKGQLEAALDDKVDKSDMFEGDANGYEYVDLGLPSGTLWSNEISYDKSVTDGLTWITTMGGDWTMPTKEQFEELINNTTYQWVTDYNGGGYNGALFTANNGNSLFMPARGCWMYGQNPISNRYGYVWTSTSSGRTNYSISFGEDMDAVDFWIPSNGNNMGFSIFAVLNKSPKYATKADLSNYVQKSSTAGLLKNDGTVDTNTYLTQHQDLSNYALASDLQALVARVEALENPSQS